MNTRSLWVRAAAFAGAALATLTNLWLIANYAYPQVAPVLLAAASHAR
jgi:hypothetical protein